MREFTIFYFLLVIFTIIALITYDYLTIKFKDKINSSQTVFTTLLMSITGFIYVIFAIYILTIDIFSENNISITTFVVTLTTLIFQQTLPKALAYVVLSEENTKNKEYEDNGKKIVSTFKLINSMVTFVLIFGIILKLAYLLISRLVYP
ncbi:hypothetical protein K4U91_05285 [Staphylococcus epidermidis]|nr:hypothetical protein [Staphylococcus epidermidis]MCG2140799.1 hypothetical protein [Staphylococcus epidermidis]MCG2143113.1 hypothetical protein [Staphylococcus epidermidis]